MAVRDLDPRNGGHGVAGGPLVRWSIQDRGGSPFFAVNQFLVSNSMQLLLFAGLTGLAVTVRANTDWHRRLMFWAFAILTGPGLGRLLPMPFFIPYAW